MKHLSRLRTPLFWAVKLALTALLLGLAFRGIPKGALLGALGRIHWPLTLAAISLYGLASIPLDALRLHGIASQLEDPEQNLGEWIRLYLESRPFFYLLPAAAGADGLIWYRLKDRLWSHRDCGLLLLLNRTWGIGVWAMAGALSLLLGKESAAILRGAPAWLLHSGFWGALGLSACVISAWGPSALGLRREFSLRPFRLSRVATVLTATATSALLQGLSVHWAARAAGIPLPFGACLGLLAWFNFAMVLPISLGGLGLQEALVLRLASPLGLATAPLLVFSVLVHLLRLTLVALGAATYLRGRPTPPPDHSGTPPRN
ncbi:MAG TPA: lysylphosphatidylglycerol synthase domain-containing protein [Holophagaceae bacterium]|nr:lysylphosphatidylglycerol synthase domain-containing protein [Holophagaceae bacterium]